MIRAPPFHENGCFVAETVGLGNFPAADKGREKSQITQNKQDSRMPTGGGRKERIDMQGASFPRFGDKLSAFAFNRLPLVSDL
jgi:hypothetical protein